MKKIKKVLAVVLAVALLAGTFTCFASAEKTYYEYEIGDTVVIEKEGRGIFLGRVIGKALTQDVEGYNIIMDIDVAAYFDAIEKEKKRAELRKEMEAKFAELDKEKKYAYYATLDKEFGELYEEFKNL